MAHGHDEHGESHAGNDAHLEWMNQHLGGAVHSFGKQFEALVERLMFFIVNGVLLKLAFFCLFLMTPVILLEFVLHTMRL